MEYFDPREQVKIWQRVHQTQPNVIENLQPMVAIMQENAAVYSHLARQLQGRGRELAMHLHEQQLAAVRCLKGVHRLVAGSVLQVGSSGATMESSEAALRKAYGQTLKTVTFCESRSADREYGAVFEALGVRQREQCRLLAELMGLLQV